MDIYLIRHTKTAAQQGLCYGQSDVELADSFPAEAHKLQQKLPEFNQENLVFSSPLTRCMQLAEKFSGTVNADSRLLELDFGDWEGLHFDTIEAGVLQQWTDDFVHAAPPNGESFTDLCRRAGLFWQALLTREAEHVLVITHAGVIRALLAHILKLPPANAFQFRVDPGSVHKIRHLDNYTYIDYINK
ncbi:MAG: alpha-ribazole phosphatase [Methylococcales bacterium]|nr:alpha-ribazole phosphatase [Methylococcales bacterium]